MGHMTCDDITIPMVNGMRTCVLCFPETSKVVLLGYKNEFSEMKSIGGQFFDCVPTTSLSSYLL